MMKAQPLTHLKKDKIFREIVKNIELLERTFETDLYIALLRAIVGQQLSIKAAQTIWERFAALYGGKPLPEKVLKTDVEVLRKVGLSYQKAGYLRNIATFAVEHGLDYQKLSGLSDEELISHLTTIKGVGRWTVEMIMMFGLGRPDVLPLDDLGIQNSIAHFYKLRYKNKRELFRKMERVAEAWRPHRSLACFYLWKSDYKSPRKTSPAKAATKKKAPAKKR